MNQCILVQGSPSECGWLQISGVSQVAKADTSRVKTIGTISDHRASNRTSNTDQPKRVYGLSIYALRVAKATVGRGYPVFRGRV